MQILQHQQENLLCNKQANKNDKHQHNKLKKKNLTLQATKYNEHPHHKNTGFNHTEHKTTKTGVTSS